MTDPAEPSSPAKPSPAEPSPQPGATLPRAALGLIALLAAALVANLAVLTSSIRQAAQQLEAQPDPYEMIDYVVTVSGDYLIEKGFAAPRVDLNDPLLAQRKIVVSEAISERSARLVVEKLLYLNEQDPDAPIDLYLATTGGWKDSAFSIIDVMERISAPVNTIAVGGCYSAGSMVLVAGTGTRSATSNTLLSIHVYPPLPDAPDDIESLDAARFAELYRTRSRTPAEVFDVQEESQPYFTAQQALAWGIVDRVIEPRPRAARAAAASQ